MRHISFFFRQIACIVALGCMLAQGAVAQQALPFTETWESGSFATQGWTPDAGGGVLAVEAGGTAGSLALKLGHTEGGGLQPASLVSGWMDASGVSPQRLLYFRFDFRFENPAKTEWELLKVYCESGNGWEEVFVNSSDGSFGWRELKVDLEAGKGGPFRLKFEAVRETDSAHGLWYIDNIQVYTDEGSMYFPLQLTANPNPAPEYGISLNWQEPVAQNQLLYQKQGVKHYANCGFLPYLSTWNLSFGSIYDLVSNPSLLLESMDLLLYFDNNWQPTQKRYLFTLFLYDWHTKSLVDTLGPFLTDKFQPPANSYFDTVWHRKVPLNLKKYTNIDTICIQLVPRKLYPQSIIGPGQVLDSCPSGGNYLTFIDFVSGQFWSHDYGEVKAQLNTINPYTGLRQGQKPGEAPAYRVFRWQESLPLNYQLMTEQPLADTYWKDTGVMKGWYDYFVEASYPGSQVYYSDTARVYMSSSLSAGPGIMAGVRAWPVPAVDMVDIESTRPFVAAEVFNLQGQRLKSIQTAATQSLRLSVSGLPAGIYQVSLRGENGKVQSVRIVVGD